MDWAADLPQMLDDFGTAATVGGVEVIGIFDAAYQDALGIAGNTPVLQCASADIPDVAQGAAVSIGARRYTVVAIEPDGTGLTLLRLQEA